MTLYHYEAMTPEGLAVSGEIKAKTLEEAQSKLRSEGKFITKIDEEKPVIVTGPYPARTQNPSANFAFAVGIFFFVVAMLALLIFGNC